MTGTFAILILSLAAAYTSTTAAQNAIVDLRKFQHNDRPALPATKNSTTNDVIVIQPKLTLRNVGALREKMTVVRGQELIGRSEFDISCSIGAAYAHIPGEDAGFRFTRQADCKAILQSESVTNPCRTRLAVNRQTKTVSLIGQACGAGSFPTANGRSHENPEDGLSSDAAEADLLAKRARAARQRASSRTAR